MAGVIITASAVTVDLGYPESADRAYEERSIARRTIGGRLRTTVLSTTYTYSLRFTFVSRATYDALTAAWSACTLTGTYPTLRWTDGPWAEPAAGEVSVGLTAGPFQSPYPDLGYGDFALVASEELPR